MAVKRWPYKDPNEKLDYDVEWIDRLGDDTIVDSVFTVVSGSVEIDSNSETEVTTTVWLTGGEIGEECEVLNRITTAAGRIMDQTTYVKIRKK